jgi:hypothetical protein
MLPLRRFSPFSLPARRCDERHDAIMHLSFFSPAPPRHFRLFSFGFL